MLEPFLNVNSFYQYRWFIFREKALRHEHVKYKQLCSSVACSFVADNRWHSHAEWLCALLHEGQNAPTF